MKKINKIGVFVFLIIGLFVFKQDVYADTCAQMYPSNITIKTYIKDAESEEFKEYEMIRGYTDNGILSIYDAYGDYTYKIITNQNIQDYYSRTDKEYRSKLFELISEKYMLTIPQKEGYNFDGWYLDKELSNKIDDYDFENISLSANLELTLYGRWTQDNVKRNIPIYEFGKDDIYIIHFKGPASVCDIYGEYIYIPNNNYMINTKETLTSLPILPDLEDESFDGWYTYYYTENDDVKYLKINNINELLKADKNNTHYINLFPKYIGKEEAPSENDTTTTGTNDTKKEDKQDNTMLYVGCSVFGIGLIAFIFVLIINKRKIKNEE